MKRSTNRILSTHVGSIIRPGSLVSAIQARQSGKEADEHAYNECLKESVADVVQRQALAGVDVVNDGEFGKSTSWSLYALKRIEGFELRDAPAGQSAFARGADRQVFKEFYDEIEGTKIGRAHV